MDETVPQTNSPSGKFRGLVHVYPLRIYFEDTDAGGVVYYANYLRYAERARTEMVRLMGYRHSDMVAGSGGIAFALAVRRCEAEYLAPAVLDDSLDVETTLTGVRAATVSCDQLVLRRGERIATIRTTLACMRLDTLRPMRLPPDLRQGLLVFLTTA